MNLSIPSKKAVKIIDEFVNTGSELLSICRIQLIHKCNQSTIGKDNVEKLEQWNTELLERLEHIFQDYTPVSYVSDIIEERYSIPKITGNFHQALSFRGKEMLEEVLPLLRRYYSILSENTDSVLYFASKTSQICFLDMVCDIEPDSNQYMLIKYILETASYGENIDFETIWREGFGENENTYDVKTQEKIKNAFEGINKKTLEIFGFSLFKKKKMFLNIIKPNLK